MTKYIFVFILVAVLAVFSVLVWFNMFGSNAPVGWAGYENAEIGFRVQHPESMQVATSTDAIGSRVKFVLAGPTEEENDDFVDGITFSVAKRSLDAQTFEGFLGTLRVTLEPVAVRGRQAYQYREEEVDEDAPAPWIVLVPSGSNAYFEIVYSFADPSNQGYQQIADQMAASFEALDPGTTSSLVIIIGILLLLGTLISGGLLLITRR